MTDLNHRRKNRKPVNQRHAENAYVNGFARQKKFHGPLVTRAFDPDIGMMVHTTNRSRTGNTDYLDKSMHGWGRVSLLADQSFGAGIGNDFTNGHRGMAQAVRGAKKFVRSRLRFHENQATRELAQHVDADSLGLG